MQPPYTLPVLRRMVMFLAVLTYVVLTYVVYTRSQETQIETVLCVTQILCLTEGPVRGTLLCHRPRAHVFVTSGLNKYAY